MDFTRVYYYLWIIVTLFMMSMTALFPWTIPIFGQVDTFDWRSFNAIVLSIISCGAVAGVLRYLSRNYKRKERRENENVDFQSLDPDSVYELQQRDYIEDSPSNRPLLRKEAIAIVGLGWILTSMLGALPFWFSGTVRAVDVPTSIQAGTQTVPVVMDYVNCLFESTSGITGFGASVIDDLENPEYVPRAILFWRSLLHFLGGAGIMLLFVAILGGNSAGKSLMQTEMTQVPQDSPYTTVRKCAWAMLSLYGGLNLVLIVILCLEGMNLFDAMCHSFGSVGTGGFSTYNNSVGHFNSPLIESTIALFMCISACNFSLMYYIFLRQPKKLLGNIEFQTYIGILTVIILLATVFCWQMNDFDSPWQSLRYSSFQVISLMTTSGFVTCDYDQWNSFSRGLLLLLLFAGGCVGSTACGLRVMRLVLLWKFLAVEVERAYSPNVVRSIRIQGDSVSNTEELRRSVLSYFCLYFAVIAISYVVLLAVEPDSTWTAAGFDPSQKLPDCATAVIASIGCVGPSFGITGPTRTFGVFHNPGKMLIILLMLLGRLEIYVIFALLSWGFWKG